jgi:hypothetical protein
MASKEEPSGGVSIGSVGGDIVGSIIAAGDVSNVTVTVGNKEMSAAETPTVEEFKQLLADIQQELAELTAQEEQLEKISDDTPLYAEVAERGVAKAVEKVKDSESMEPEEAESIQRSLKKAAGTLKSILEEAKHVAETAGEVGAAVKPIAEQLMPLVEKVGVAALWVGKLWLV